LYRKILEIAEDDDTGSTIVHDAVLGRRKMTVNDSLDIEPWSLNTLDNCGCTPLHWAALKQQVETIKTLLVWKPDLELRDRRGRTALNITAEITALGCAQALVDAGSDVNAAEKYGRTPLHWAVVSHSVDIVQLLLSNGADPHAREKRNGDTAFHLPARSSFFVDESVLLAIFEALLSAGADINSRNKRGQTPVLSAIGYNYVAMFRTLARLGADLNIIDQDGSSVLHLAGQYSSMEMLEALKEADFSNVDPDSVDSHGITAMDFFVTRIERPAGELEGGQNKPTDDERAAFEVLIRDSRERYRNVQRSKSDMSDSDSWIAEDEALFSVVSRPRFGCYSQAGSA
jgi:ankyrin repeat protein